MKKINEDYKEWIVTKKLVQDPFHGCLSFDTEHEALVWKINSANPDSILVFRNRK